MPFVPDTYFPTDPKLADWRAERRTLGDQLQATIAGVNDKPQRETARVAAELAHLQTTFARADPQ